ncbi:phospholipid/cholesterol/gamma-HCH transport system ATP-binding protein [Thermomonas hydrothermalis]|uniref:Phospholipid/cholesterol/gamma-HCH transport system ATP-binding protein n=2 Tax=Thermomonas hydrothermalis TaxID=213588 RepID=A0A1M4TXU6_9GAMM|nr:phospholipid/cholesterol/gamma-HCH transport system ATP-binding protein [Thermomonas hydrothermalis]
MLRGYLSGPVQPVEIPIPMTATTAVVHLSNVRLEYGGRAVLRGINLSVAKGSMTAVLGPSGSGKSTLLAAITGELVPAQGQVEVFGQPVPRDARGLLAMRKRLGVLLQGNGLLTDLTVLENVALPLRAHSGLPAAEIQARALAKLEAVGLAAAADRFPRELSGGMARRAALARALALDPPLLLCDEPLTGLDPIASGVVMSLLRQLNQSLGLTCIVVSHHVRETLPVCDQAVVVANGGLAFDGTPEALQASQDPLLRQFLDGSPHGPIAFDDVTGQRAA